jgi:hypothetical protein
MIYNPFISVPILEGNKKGKDDIHYEYYLRNLIDPP